MIRKMPLLVTRASPSSESIALAKLYCTLSHKYSIAKLRSFDNGTNVISINFYGLLLIPEIRFFCALGINVFFGFALSHQIGLVRQNENSGFTQISERA